MLRSLRIGTRILLSLVVALALMLVIGSVSYFTARNLTQHLGELSDAQLPSVNALWAVDQAVTDVESHLNQLLLPGADESIRKRATSGFRDAQQRIDDSSYAYISLPRPTATLPLWNEASMKLEDWRGLARKVSTIALNEGGAGFAEAGFEEGSTARADPCGRCPGREPPWQAHHQDRGGGGVEHRGRPRRRKAGPVGGGGHGGPGGGPAGRLRGGAGSDDQPDGGDARLRGGAAWDAVAAGRLSVRGDVAALDREFKPIVQGMNETMEAFEKPLRVTVEYVGRIGKGDIPAKIEEEYRGDFELIRTSINDCIDAVNSLLADAGTLAHAGVEGRLSTRAEASRHQGAFRKIVQGVNETLDAVMGPLSVAATCVDRIARGEIPERIGTEYRGDFELLRRNLNTCIDAVNGLVADAKALSAGAVAGQLGVRADATRHQGEFRASCRASTTPSRLWSLHFGWRASPSSVSPMVRSRPTGATRCKGTSSRCKRV